VEFVARPLAAAGVRRSGIPDAGPRGVQGSIKGRDVLLHSVTILRLFGPGVYLRCIRAMVERRPCTFLEMLADER
jgi:hypothetical protein